MGERAALKSIEKRLATKPEELAALETAFDDKHGGDLGFDPQKNWRGRVFSYTVFNGALLRAAGRKWKKDREDLKRVAHELAAARKILGVTGRAQLDAALEARDGS